VEILVTVCVIALVLLTVPASAFLLAAVGLAALLVPASLHALGGERQP